MQLMQKRTEGKGKINFNARVPRTVMSETPYHGQQNKQFVGLLIGYLAYLDLNTVDWSADDPNQKQPDMSDLERGAVPCRTNLHDKTQMCLAIARRRLAAIRHIRRTQLVEVRRIG